mmetsp:Transcript_47262/g.93584  ORF Transcript_47262/g.93584 Transcript_47262/m.93584 type:complete len:245 (-) Transcript_47262:553-1287(-)
MPGRSVRAAPLRLHRGLQHGLAAHHNVQDVVVFHLRVQGAPGNVRARVGLHRLDAALDGCDGRVAHLDGRAELGERLPTQGIFRVEHHGVREALLLRVGNALEVELRRTGEQIPGPMPSAGALRVHVQGFHEILGVIRGRQTIHHPSQLRLRFGERGVDFQRLRKAKLWRDNRARACRIAIVQPAIGQSAGVPSKRDAFRGRQRLHGEFLGRGRLAVHVGAAGHGELRQGCSHAIRIHGLGLAE